MRAPVRVKVWEADIAHPVCGQREEAESTRTRGRRATTDVQDVVLVSKDIHRRPNDRRRGARRGTQKKEVQQERRRWLRAAGRREGCSSFTLLGGLFGPRGGERVMGGGRRSSTHTGTRCGS